MIGESERAMIEIIDRGFTVEVHLVIMDYFGNLSYFKGYLNEGYTTVALMLDNKFLPELTVYIRRESQTVVAYGKGREEIDLGIQSHILKAFNIAMGDKS